ncbi:aldo/keto reductase [Halorubellus sp. JP-L1]|uniref:aldo/keto reductase n=1 Tax=Halorubellus sp. JP-L1 TaxID=2715753 RepID=UPI001407AB66|nr:aldo/keto reductase [Halorubellus sp. JP-L1]NHN40391.1 aldo/keto reductase [Halorubellus sp. JP-L1]
MEHVPVGDDDVPAIGLGTWKLTGQTAYGTLKTALSLGYRHVDTAQAYENERHVGNAIADGDVDRDDVFLTTKVRPDRYEPGDLAASVRESLDRLDTDYVDLLLLHWPNPLSDLDATLRAMADLVDDGAVSHVGVSNFSRRQLEKAIARSPVPIATNQVQFHPFKPQRELLRFCQDNDVMLTAYSPLAHGAVLDDDLLWAIGRQYDKTPAQVALRWATQHRGVCAVPKSQSREHLAQNLDVFDFALDADEMERIARPSGLKTAETMLRGMLG